MIALQDLGFGKALSERLDTLDYKSDIINKVETLKNSTPQEIFSSLLDDALDFGLKLIAAIAIYIIGLWVISRIKKTVKRTMQKRGTDKSIVTFVQSLLSVILTLVLFVLVISALGINTTSLAAILAAFGMAMGMALSGAMSNFAGGILLLIFKPFKSGDFVETGAFSGIVDSISIFNTKITTPDNKVVYIPNGSISNSPINNYTQNPTRRIEWRIDTEYGTDVELMRKVCLDVLAADHRVLNIAKGAPADPSCNIMTLRDSSVQFVIRCWANTSDYWDLFFEINNKLYTTLPQKGISFPFPQLDVHIDKD